VDGGDLSLTAHVSHITSVCFFNLRELRLIRRSLTVDTAHVLVCTLVHSRLDYCNAVLAGLPANQLSRLQSVLRAAARLVPCRASVSAAMRNSLHWLGYPQRVSYKSCLLMCKCLQGWAPAYLARLCVPIASVAGRSRLRSADDNELVIPGHRQSHSVTTRFHRLVPHHGTVCHLRCVANLCPCNVSNIL